MLAVALNADVPDDLTTRERIKRAARRLFALNGIDAVSVRDIVREAGGKNVPALNYYFGSKEELIETLIRDALAAANARWDEALSALEAAGGPNSVREVVEILVLRGLPASVCGLALLSPGDTLRKRRQRIAFGRSRREFIPGLHNTAKWPPPPGGHFTSSTSRSIS